MNITHRENRFLTIIVGPGLVLALLVAALSVLPPRPPVTAAGAVSAIRGSARADEPNTETAPPNRSSPVPPDLEPDKSNTTSGTNALGNSADRRILFPQPMTQQSPPGPQLYLHRGTFDIKTAQQFAPTSSLAAAAPGPYAIIQLYGPITLADRQALEGTGIKLLEYLPDYAYLVQGTATQREAAARLPHVYAHTSFTLADKLAPALLRAIARGDKSTWQVRIVGWRGEEDTLARELATLGLERQVAADAKMLLRMAKLESVRWIEPIGRPRIINDYARDIMDVEPVWQNHQLFGAGQIIAVTDSGLDTGDLNTISPDFAGRIVATHVLSTGGHWDDNHGHGTHVAGSMAGAGVQSGANPAQHAYAGSFAGMAPEAGLVIQAFEALLDGTVVGLDPDYYQLFHQAYSDGARVHSDSWGDNTGPISDTEAAYGGYPYGSQRTDQFMWDHPDMAIFFAAGNSGVDGTPTPPFGFCTGSDGVVDADSLLAPGTAKNVITVGATESNRSTGGLGPVPWLLLNLCFGVQPIATDLVADNADGMAAFSSRGPADDGRVKPDIVAPGTNIVSNRSHAPGASTLWATHETYPDHYVYSGGTSMATPLVAGVGVLVREWLLSQGYANPSAAAIKAVLLNTTTDIAPGQYGTSDAQEIPFQRPNDVAGWGRAALRFIDAPSPYTLWLDDHSSGLVTGEAVSYTHTLTRPLEVLTNTQPLRVMLVWTDPPASLSASSQLVNDLDLVVTGPGGATYYGNDVPFGDRTNNVEGVIVNDPPIGSYHVQVSGFNVPLDSQPYALVVAGPLKYTHAPSLAVIKTANVSTAEVGQTITYTYRVTNTGTATLTGVTGSDDKLGLVTLSPATLVPSQSATGVLTYIVKMSDLPGPLTNTVVVSGTPPLGLPVTATVGFSVNLAGSTTITVAKTANVSTAEVGQTITYTYRVTNNGAVPLTGITGNDDKLGQVAFSLDTLAPNQIVTSTVTYTVRPSDLPGPLINVVAVSGTTAVGSPVVVSATATEAVDLVASSDIVLTKRADPDTVEAGAQFTYTIYVTNTGVVDLHATITDTLPLSVTLGKTSGSTLLPPGGPMEIVWTASITALGGVWMEQVVVTVIEGYTGPLTNVVEVTTVEGATGVYTETSTVIARRSIYLPLIIRSA